MAKSESVTRRAHWWSAFCGSATPADIRNNRRLIVAMVVWMAAFLGSITAMNRFGRESPGISTAALAVAVLAWVPVVLAYLRFLRETDELTRMIQTKAMAVGFAAGLLASLLDRFVVQLAGFLPDPLWGPLEFTDLFNPALVMCATFVITTMTLHRWYSR